MFIYVCLDVSKICCQDFEVTNAMLLKMNASMNDHKKDRMTNDYDDKYVKFVPSLQMRLVMKHKKSKNLNNSYIEHSFFSDFKMQEF